MPSNFVNPYAFLPLSAKRDAVVRRPPLGHVVPADKAAERYSGSIDVTWTLVTPMLLPLGHEESGVLDADGYVTLPGSTLKGMTRSLHEALFNGCMRVIDLDFVPGYRDPARGADPNDPAGQEDWRLALVTASDDNGNPTTVRLCEDEVWLDAARLFTAYGGRDLPTTGDVVDFTGRPSPRNTLGRIEQDDISALEVAHRSGSKEVDLKAVEGRVFLATSVGARRPYIERPGQPRRKGRCLWASGVLGPRFVNVAQAVARDLRAATDGSDDRRRLRQQEDAAGLNQAANEWRRRRVFEPVVFWRPNNAPMGPIARRAKHTGFLWPGDVIWVRMDSRGEIDQIRLSRLWRHGGHDSVAMRTSKSYHPCSPTSGEGLCLSCSIFGAIDAAAGRGKGDQAAYASHVRFGSARSLAPVKLRKVPLTPMGAPRPGTGMFYLQNDTTLPPDRPIGDRATEWGSSEDRARLRQIAGRKFYWHSDPDAQAQHWSVETGGAVAPRYEAAGGQLAGNMTRRGVLVEAGSKFHATISFDALDELSLVTLLWSIDPTRILRLPPMRRNASFAVHLGGGKPLGLGSATVAVDEIRATTVLDRYGATGSQPLDEPVTHVPTAVLVARVGILNRNLEALARLLDLSGLGEDGVRVAYPPGTSWDGVGTDRFRESYRFFTKADGLRLRYESKPWRPLPTVTDKSDPTLLGGSQ